MGSSACFRVPTLPADVALSTTFRDFQAFVIVNGPLLSGCAACLDQVLCGDCEEQHGQSHHPRGGMQVQGV